MKDKEKKYLFFNKRKIIIMLSVMIAGQACLKQDNVLNKVSASVDLTKENNVPHFQNDMNQSDMNQDNMNGSQTAAGGGDLNNLNDANSQNVEYLVQDENNQNFENEQEYSGDGNNEQEYSGDGNEEQDYQGEEQYGEQNDQNNQANYILYNQNSKLTQSGYLQNSQYSGNVQQIQSEKGNQNNPYIRDGKIWFHPKDSVLHEPSSLGGYSGKIRENIKHYKKLDVFRKGLKYTLKTLGEYDFNDKKNIYEKYRKIEKYYGVNENYNILEDEKEESELLKKYNSDRVKRFIKEKKDGVSLYSSYMTIEEAIEKVFSDNMDLYSNWVEKGFSSYVGPMLERDLLKLENYVGEYLHYASYKNEELNKKKYFALFGMKLLDIAMCVEYMSLYIDYLMGEIKNRRTIENHIQYCYENMESKSDDIITKLLEFENTVDYLILGGIKQYLEEILELVCENFVFVNCGKNSEGIMECNEINFRETGEGKEPSKINKNFIDILIFCIFNKPSEDGEWNVAGNNVIDFADKIRRNMKYPHGENKEGKDIQKKTEQRYLSEIENIDFNGETFAGYINELDEIRKMKNEQEEKKNKSYVLDDTKEKNLCYKLWLELPYEEFKKRINYIRFYVIILEHKLTKILRMIQNLYGYNDEELRKSCEAMLEKIESDQEINFERYFNEDDNEKGMEEKDIMERKIFHIYHIDRLIEKLEMYGVFDDLVDFQDETERDLFYLGRILFSDKIEFYFYTYWDFSKIFEKEDKHFEVFRFKGDRLADEELKACLDESNNISINKNYETISDDESDELENNEKNNLKQSDLLEVKPIFFSGDKNFKPLGSTIKKNYNNYNNNDNYNDNKNNLNLVDDLKSKYNVKDNNIKFKSYGDNNKNNYKNNDVNENNININNNNFDKLTEKSKNDFDDNIEKSLIKNSNFENEKGGRETMDNIKQQGMNDVKKFLEKPVQEIHFKGNKKKFQIDGKNNMKQKVKNKLMINNIDDDSENLSMDFSKQHVKMLGMKGNGKQDPTQQQPQDEIIIFGEALDKGYINDINMKLLQLKEAYFRDQQKVGNLELLVEMLFDNSVLKQYCNQAPLEFLYCVVVSGVFDPIEREYLLPTHKFALFLKDTIMNKLENCYGKQYSKDFSKIVPDINFLEQEFCSKRFSREEIEIIVYVDRIVRLCSKKAGKYGKMIHNLGIINNGDEPGCVWCDMFEGRHGCHHHDIDNSNNNPINQTNNPGSSDGNIDYKKMGLRLLFNKKNNNSPAENTNYKYNNLRFDSKSVDAFKDILQGIVDEIEEINGYGYYRRNTASFLINFLCSLYMVVYQMSPENFEHEEENPIAIKKRILEIIENQLLVQLSKELTNGAIQLNEAQEIKEVMKSCAGSSAIENFCDKKENLEKVIKLFRPLPYADVDDILSLLNQSYSSRDYSTIFSRVNCDKNVRFNERVYGKIKKLLNYKVNLGNLDRNTKKHYKRLFECVKNLENRMARRVYEAIRDAIDRSANTRLKKLFRKYEISDGDGIAIEEIENLDYLIAYVERTVSFYKSLAEYGVSNNNERLMRFWDLDSDYDDYDDYDDYGTNKSFKKLGRHYYAGIQKMYEKLLADLKEYKKLRDENSYGDKKFKEDVEKKARILISDHRKRVLEIFETLIKKTHREVKCYVGLYKQLADDKETYTLIMKNLKLMFKEFYSNMNSFNMDDVRAVIKLFNNDWDDDEISVGGIINRNIKNSVINIKKLINNYVKKIDKNKGNAKPKLIYSLLKTIIVSETVDFMIGKTLIGRELTINNFDLIENKKREDVKNIKEKYDIKFDKELLPIENLVNKVDVLLDVYCGDYILFDIDYSYSLDSFRKAAGKIKSNYKKEKDAILKIYEGEELFNKEEKEDKKEKEDLEDTEAETDADEEEEEEEEEVKKVDVDMDKLKEAKDGYLSMKMLGRNNGVTVPVYLKGSLKNNTLYVEVHGAQLKKQDSMLVMKLAPEGIIDHNSATVLTREGSVFKAAINLATTPVHRLGIHVIEKYAEDKTPASQTDGNLFISAVDVPNIWRVNEENLKNAEATEGEIVYDTAIAAPLPKKPVIRIYKLADNRMFVRLVESEGVDVSNLHVTVMKDNNDPNKTPLPEGQNINTVAEFAGGMKGFIIEDNICGLVGKKFSIHFYRNERKTPNFLFVVEVDFNKDSNKVKEEENKKNEKTKMYVEDVDDDYDEEDDLEKGKKNKKGKKSKGKKSKGKNVKKNKKEEIEEDDEENEEGNEDKKEEKDEGDLEKKLNLIKRNDEDDDSSDYEYSTDIDDDDISKKLYDKKN